MVSQISDFQEQLPLILKILGILIRHVVSEFRERMNFMAKSTPKKLVVLVLSAVMALSCLATGAVSTASAREADELDPSGMKVTAVRTWGTGTAGAPAGHVKIDNYVTGSFNGVVLEPDSSYIPSTDIGKYDVKVSLSQTNS